MYAVSLDRQGQVASVIDDECHAKLSGNLPQRHCLNIGLLH
jgi:hypothetical protein